MWGNPMISIILRANAGAAIQNHSTYDGYESSKLKNIETYIYSKYIKHGALF